MFAAPTDPSALETTQQVAADILASHRGQLRELTIRVVEEGIVIRGRAASYYGKQIAFHEVSRRCKQPVVANEVEVQSPQA